MSKRSAEEMTRTQSVALAESYLNEILSQSFNDPGGPAEMGRSDFDDVTDYVMNNAVPADRFGTPIAALANYRVSVSVTPTSLGTITALNCRLIKVTVTDPFGDVVVLSGFKTAHP
jgi:MSHA pilin protein MshD